MIQCYQPEVGGMCKLLDGNLCLGQFEEGRRALLIGHEGIGGRFGGDVEYKVVLYQSFTSSPRYLTTHFLGKISPVFTWPNQCLGTHCFYPKIENTKLEVGVMVKEYSKIDMYSSNFTCVISSVFFQRFLLVLPTIRGTLHDIKASTILS